RHWPHVHVKHTRAAGKDRRRARPDHGDGGGTRSSTRMLTVVFVSVVTAVFPRPIAFVAPTVPLSRLSAAIESSPSVDWASTDTSPSPGLRFLAAASVFG